MSAFIAALAMFFVFPKVVSAQITINEFSAKTDPEWVEVYNSSTESADLEGWEISDGNSISSDDLTISGIIPPNGFLVFSRPKGWLNDSGDTINLYDNSTPSGSLIDSFTYNSSTEGKTTSRIPDGSGDFIYQTNPTKEEINQAPPTPTSTPTSTSTPTVTATPTPSPSPKVLSAATTSSVFSLFFQDSTVSSKIGSSSSSVKSKLGVNLTLAGLGLLLLSVSILIFRNKS